MEAAVFIVLALSSAVLWGIWAFGVGRSSRHASAWMVILVSEGCAALIYLVMGLATDALVFDRADVVPGLIAGLLNLGGNVLILSAYARGKLGVAAGIKPAQVLIPLSYSFIIGQQLHPLVAFGVIAILIGLSLFGFSSARLAPAGGTDLRQVFLAVGAAICYGLGNVVMDIGSRTSVYGTLLVSMIPMLTGAVLLVLITRSYSRLDSRTLGILVGAGAALGLGAVAFYTASDIGDLGLVAVLGSMSPIVTALLAFAFLKERLSRMEITALAVVLFGTALAIA
ncbi:MAG: EamA family transporter [Actinomycetales bacterium]